MLTTFLIIAIFLSAAMAIGCAISLHRDTRRINEWLKPAKDLVTSSSK